MELTEQTRRNIEIAKMMGYEIDNSFPDKNKVWRLGKKIDLETDLAYHTDAWLMPVVRWIAEIKSVGSSFDFFRMRCAVTECKIYTPTEQLFISVSDFAEWYNGQKQ